MVLDIGLLPSSKDCAVTSEQRVHAYVAQGEADDGGLVQVGSRGGLQRQEARQIAEHVRLNPSPPSGRLTADCSANRKRSKILTCSKILRHVTVIS